MIELEVTEEFNEWLKQAETRAVRKYLEERREAMAQYPVTGALHKFDATIEKEVRDRASRVAILSDIIEILEEENEAGNEAD